MSHSKEPIICPNCSHQATGNYCAQCGQENHLHKETFWGLVMHFIGHYFHYDSKFWQTMKALLFSPGKLTIAYWNKQRMRYIAPVSLYIFISAVYFLLSLLHHKDETVKGKAAGNVSHISVLPASGIAANDSGSAKYILYFEHKIKEINDKHGNINEFVKSNISHNMPKIFFFMIPVMALLLKLLFVRRKDTFFVDHAIFALHYHSFWFSLFAILHIHFPEAVKDWLYIILFIVAFVYMVAAIHNVYKTGWARSVWKSIVLSATYAISLGLVMFTYLLLVIVLA